jgi:hypothetical protein
MLREQGIANPALRRAVAGGVLSFNHYEDEIDGVERMWVQQVCMDYVLPIPFLCKVDFWFES